MQCPFCHAANAATARACRVCGAPLRAKKPIIAPISIEPVLVTPTPIASAPSEIARHIFTENFDENFGELVSADFLTLENIIIGLVRTNGVVQLWNTANGEIFARHIGPMFRKINPIVRATLAPGAVITAHQSGAVQQHTFDGRAQKKPSSHIGRVLALAANETHFYSGGSDGVIWSTPLNNKKAKSRALLEGLGALATFAVAPDANSIAVGCDDGAICLWRFDAEKAAFQLDWTRNVHDSMIRSLAFSPNGNMILSRDKSGSLSLWAAQTSYQLPLATEAQLSYVAPAFSSDSRLLALANAENIVSIFDVALGALFCELPPFAEPIAHISFATNAPWLLVAGAREIAVWNIF